MSPHEQESGDWLENEDSAGREDRIQRLAWVAELMPQAEYLGFPGGWLSKCHFEEMRYCFVYGQFIAVIFLGLAYIERTLAANFYASGRDDLERANISLLLREAVASGAITRDEFQRCDKAREMRNAFSHFRRPLHEDSVEYRATSQNDTPYAIIEDDARHIIETVFRIVARNAI